MIFRTFSHFRAAMDTIRRSKLRSFWTMLGIIIGVASVITVVGIGEGVKDQVGGQIHHYGSNLITVRTGAVGASSSASSGLGALDGFSVSAPLTAKDINTVSKVNGVDASAPLTLISGTIKGQNGIYRRGFVLGTSSALPSLLNQSLAYGGFLDGPTTTNIAVIGQNAADVMFNENVPLGQSFSFHNQTFVVGGIFNQFTATPLNQQANLNNAIFIPNSEAESLSDNTAPTFEILARAGSGYSVSLVARNITDALNSTHGGDSGFSVMTGNQNFASNNNILNLLTRLIAGVAAISLLVAGIGIMNVMLVSVTERVREIGIKKAVGATNRQILGQFMFEAILISLMGGVGGVVLAYLIDIGIVVATNFRPSIGWHIVVLATGVSLLVGVVFGTVPAVKAARKDPIDALRAE